MGSFEYSGITFRVYSGDHDPPHLHCRYQGIEVIVELGADRTVRLSDRANAVRPVDAKRSHVRRVLDTAGARFDDLLKLWEDAHA